MQQSIPLDMCHLDCRTQAGQRRLFKVDQVVNEDASLDFAYQHTAGSLVQRVQREGGSGCFITLGLPCSGKTFLMEVTTPVSIATSAGFQ